MRVLPCRCRSYIYPGCLSDVEYSDSVRANLMADSDIHPLARCHDGQVGMSNGETAEEGPLQTTCPVNTGKQTSISNRTRLIAIRHWSRLKSSITEPGINCPRCARRLLEYNSMPYYGTDRRVTLNPILPVPFGKVCDFI